MIIHQNGAGVMHAPCGIFFIFLYFLSFFFLSISTLYVWRDVKCKWVLSIWMCLLPSSIRISIFMRMIISNVNKAERGKVGYGVKNTDCESMRHQQNENRTWFRYEVQTLKHHIHRKSLFWTRSHFTDANVRMHSYS